MKNKLVKILLLVMCIILVTGCKKGSDWESEPELRFNVHPEAKYNMYWKYEKNAPKDVIKFTKTEFVHFEENNTEGYTGEAVYVVEGLKEGKTTVIFQTYEPDGKTTHPKQTYKYEFTVNKDKEVKVNQVK